MSRAWFTRGITLIELVVAVLILGILIAIALPSFNTMFQKNRLKGAAERLAAETQFARSEALSRRVPITVTVTPGANWCIGVDQSAAACDCSVANPADASACAIDGVLRVANFNDFEGVEIQGANRAATFEPVRGIPAGAVNDWPVIFENVAGQEVGVRLTVLGSVHMCSPTGAGNLWDYPDC